MATIIGPENQVLAVLVDESGKERGREVFDQYGDAYSWARCMWLKAHMTYDTLGRAVGIPAGAQKWELREY